MQSLACNLNTPCQYNGEHTETEKFGQVRDRPNRDGKPDPSIDTILGDLKCMVEKKDEIFDIYNQCKPENTGTVGSLRTG